jgi:NADH-quinone oxidoreductase subunit F
VSGTEKVRKLVKTTDTLTIAQAFEDIRKKADVRWKPENGDRPLIMVGTGTCGRASGALEVLQALRDEVKRQNIDCPVIEVGCIGHCYAEPLVVVNKPGSPAICYSRVNPVIAERLVKDYIMGDDPHLEFVLAAIDKNELIPSFSDFPRAQYEQKIILHNCGQVDPEDIDHYISQGGYVALTKTLQMQPTKVLGEVKKSGLRGRGGAGFPAGRKWEICRQAKGRPKHIICNGDEGDPGAFMDRTILESDPHSVIEGMIIAGYAVGARYGHVYVRAEYPLAVQRVEIAIKQAREGGLLGRNILGSSFSFDIRLFQGSGAFVCGEATALVASIEGDAGMPRPRPPHMATHGLFGKPTVLNNVKTFAYVRHIIENGSKWFASIGTRGSTGTAVFALAGKIVNTGLVEVPMGTTLRQVIFDVGSGVPDGKSFKAVQIGGPSGGCLPESALDLPIDFDSLTGAGAMMGSGGMVVLDEDDCMVEMARYFLEFTQRESCGKCTPCRLGTRQMLEMLNDIVLWEGKPEDLDKLTELAEDVKAASLCGLGQTAPNPVLSTLRYFRDEYESHINEGRCPALMCKELIAFYIKRDKCERSCDACIGSCTVEAISPDKNRIKVIDQEKCVKCGLCLEACPPQFDAIVKLSPPTEVPGAKSKR